MVERKAKPTIILLSESEDEHTDEAIEDEEEEDAYEDDDDDDDEDEDASSPSSSDEESEWSCGDEEADLESIEDDSEGSSSLVDELSGYDRVLDRLKERRDLEVLKLDECKAYLRKHGLRITGTKTTLIQRIQEHWRIKDGNGEKLYPRSSFSINCTGDVCRGDVVMFTQRVYEKFDKMTRRGNPLGKRSVAGRIVKESYGAAKQQHTFTVEVLWSKGYKKLPPLFPLLVKGRNLYRMRTFRQRWGNEAERSKVLAEKHKRGAAARKFREMKKAHSEGAKRTRSNPSAMGHSDKPKKRCRKEEPEPKTRSETRKDDFGRGKAKSERIVKQVVAESSARHLVQTRPNENRGFPHHAYTHTSPPLNNHYGAQMEFQPRYAASTLHPNVRPFSSFGYEVGSTSRHYPDTRVMPELPHHGFNHSSHMHHRYNNPGYQLDQRHMHYNLNHRQLTAVPLGAETYRGFGMRCSTPGCGDQRAENCVVFSCWRCCRMTGRRCPRHHP